jgi:hypothetical protein
MNPRYFIVFFVCYYGDTYIPVNYCIPVTSISRKYPNYNTLLHDVPKYLEEHGNLNKNLKHSGVTNILEVNQKDYDNYFEITESKML